jgi:hypothetical protein
MSLNLTTLALVWLGGSLILLPLMILTIRLALLPLIETITRPRTAGSEERIARLEQKVGQLGRELERMSRAPAHPAES